MEDVPSKMGHHQPAAAVLTLTRAIRQITAHPPAAVGLITVTAAVACRRIRVIAQAEE